MKTAGPGPAVVLVFLLAAAALSAQSADDLLSAGKKAFSDGFYAVAEGSFQQIISAFPQAPAAVEAEYLLGVTRYYAGQWAECLVVLDGFQERHPASPLASRVPYWLGASYLRLGSYDKALRLLQAVAGKAKPDARDGATGAKPVGPYSEHAALLCGVALEGLGRDAEAGGFYRRVMSPGGDPSLVPEATWRLAGTEYRVGHFSPARDLYSRILLDFPQSSFVRDSVFFLGESELALGNPDSAEKRFATVTSVYPDSQYREACFYRLADIAYRRHDTPGALRRLDQLGKQFPQGSYRGSSLRMRGDIFFDQKRFEEAIAAFEKALSILADGAEKQAAWYSLGLADLMLDRKTRAAEAFGKAGTGLAKDLGEKARLQRGLLLAGLGRADDAIEALEDLVHAFPDGPHAEEALKLLASLLDSRMEYDKSFLRWDSLVKLYPRSPSFPEYIFRRGVVCMNQGDPAALDDFQRVMRDYPASGFRDESEYSIGYAYSRRGEYARALPFFREVALRSAGSDVGDRSSLAIGVSLFNMGSFDKALATLEYLDARHPGDQTEATVKLYAGRALYRMERLSEAAERLAAASMAIDRLQPGPAHAAEAADARYWLGWALYRSGKLAEARDAFLSLARDYGSDPRSPEAMYRAGVCETLGGNDESAVKLFDAVSTGEAGLSSGQWREQALYEKGWALSRMGSGEESLAAFKKLAAEFPGGRLAPEAFFKLAMKAFDEERYAEARSGFQAVARDFPRSDLARQALYWTAESTRRSGDAKGSLEELWTSLVSHPGSGLLPVVLQSFAAALQSTGSLEAARDYAEKARDAQGLEVQAVASIELDYADMLLPGDPAGALTVLDDVRRRSPPEPLAGEATLLTGKCFAARLDWQRALDIFSALSDTRADEVGARATAERARALESTGNLTEAANQYLRIAYIFPGFSELAAEGMFNAARLASQAGDKDNAARISGQLRKRYPDSPWVKRLDEGAP